MVAAFLICHVEIPVVFTPSVLTILKTFIIFVGVSAQTETIMVNANLAITSTHFKFHLKNSPCVEVYVGHTDNDTLTPSPRSKLHPILELK